MRQALTEAQYNHITVPPALLVTEHVLVTECHAPGAEGASGADSDVGGGGGGSGDSMAGGGVRCPGMVRVADACLWGMV